MMRSDVVGVVERRRGREGGDPAMAVDTVITVAGEMSGALRAEFDDLDVAVGHSVTTIRVPGSDPSVLHGVINRVQLLGLELLDVQRLSEH
jgi:hypothetical protein